MAKVYRDLTHLVSLAKEPSSEKRRELLRNITDLFMETPEEHSESEKEKFGDILGSVARDMEMEVRRALAQRLSSVPNAPRNVIIQLANDEISVARPVLTNSIVLKDADLIALSKLQSQEHLHAVAARPTVSAAVSDALVARGDDNVLARLAGNAGAALSRSAMETMVDRAQNATVLHAPLVGRKSLPPDLLNSMFFAVSSELKRSIMQRMKEVEPSLIDDAIRLTERRMKRTAVAADPAEAKAQVFMENLQKSGPVTESLLFTLAKQKRFAEAHIVLGKLAGIDLRTARRIFEDRNPEGLAIVCRACRFDRQTFSTLVLSREQSAEEVKSLGDAFELLQLYDQVPIEAAQRVMRFWRLRQGTGDAVAA
jgi:uncharacterized protein (DUF2336 family)